MFCQGEDSLKMTVTGCHSALDAESRFSFFWMPAFSPRRTRWGGRGMTIFSAHLLSIEEFSDKRAGRADAAFERI